MANEEDLGGKNKDPEVEEKSFEMTELVDELQKVYPNVNRGVIYEASICISDEKFLENYLAQQQIANSPSNKQLTIGDLFQEGDMRELNTVIGLGKKAGMSKGIIIGVSALLSAARTIYQVFTNDDIKKELTDIDVAHSKSLLAKAKALTDEADGVDQTKTTSNKTNKDKK